MSEINIDRLAEMLEEADSEDARGDWSWQDVARHLADNRDEWLTDTTHLR